MDSPYLKGTLEVPHLWNWKLNGKMGCMISTRKSLFYQGMEALEIYRKI